MIKNVLNTLQKHKMLEGVNAVTVALSGGADSMALLHILNSLKNELNITVYAAHLNHCLRGADADSDEKTVVKFCEELNIPLFCERIDVKTAAENSKDSVETVARNIRYNFLNRVAVGVVATAHTASDNLETVIFNTVRGSGLKGLCGIPAKRDNIIRPLIECTREQVETYCKQNGLNYCTDKTNFDETYSRNNIRKNIVPKLKQINGNAEQNVTRLSEIVAQDENCLSQMAKEQLLKLNGNKGLDICKLKQLHKAIIFRVLKMFCEEATNTVPEYLHIKKIWEVILSNSGSVNLKNNFTAKIKENKLIIVKAKEESFANDYFCFPKSFEQVSYKNYTFTYKKFEEIVNFNDLPFKNAIDYDTILNTPVLRNRKPGDKITLTKRKVTKTLKKLFCEQKTENRNNLLVLADSENVIWVETVGVNLKNKVTQKTKNVLFIEKRRSENDR